MPFSVSVWRAAGPSTDFVNEMEVADNVGQAQPRRNSNVKYHTSAVNVMVTEYWMINRYGKPTGPLYYVSKYSKHED